MIAGTMRCDNCVLRAALTASMLAAGVFAAQTVEGHVVNSVTGADIPGLTVNLIQAGVVAYSASTGPEGHFRIEAVKPGAYTATYTARGFRPVPDFFVDERLELECGRCFPVERRGQPIQVADGGLVRPEVKMQPIVRISGTVLDDAGNPVPNASLQLHWGESWLCKIPSCIGFSRQSKANEKGEYSADLDLPGAWLLSAIAPSSWNPPESRGDQRIGWAQTFYPGVTDSQLAVKVMVRSGSETSNLDIKLAAVPVHRVRGRVLDPGGNPLPLATATLSTGAGSSAMFQNTAGDGTFEFGAVAEGNWRIFAKLDQGGTKLWAARWVEVKDHDLENLELRASTPFAIHGKVVMEVPEGALAPKAPSITLAFNAGAVVLADNPAGNFVTANPDANGDFTIRNVYPGPYQILPGPSPARYYLDSIRLGAHDALESAVEIQPGAEPLTITYKPGGGSLRGTVEKCAGGTVRLLPRDMAMWRQGFRLFAPCDANDRYEITAVRPGEYYVLAIAGDSPTPWYLWDDDRLADNAGTVTVRAGEDTSADLRAIRP